MDHFDINDERIQDFDNCERNMLKKHVSDNHDGRVQINRDFEHFYLRVRNFGTHDYEFMIE